MDQMYLGVDNGLSGALALLSSSGTPVWDLPMPVVKRGKNNELDIAELHRKFLELREVPNVTVVIEGPAKFSPGKMALCSMHQCYGTLMGIIGVLGFRTHVITAPRTWQKEFWSVTGGYDTKVEALRVARMLWPQDTFLRTPKCSKPDTGIVDARLIAEYGRRRGF